MMAARFLKTAASGSSVGVERVADPAALALRGSALLATTPWLLVEAQLTGREFTGAVLEAPDGAQTALPIVEIRPRHEIYDYECKYTKGMSEYEVPAPIPEEITEEVQLLAVKAHRILRLSAYSRVDFRLDESGAPWCFEANSLPGMTATSLLPKAAAARDVPFEQLCERIVNLALEDPA